MWKEHGALEYYECIGDDLETQNMVSFEKAADAGEGDTVVFSWITYKSREPRDKKTVFVETSIISYQTARSSRDLLAAAWQKAIIDWWDTQRGRFDLFGSELVIEEAKRGDDLAAARRLKALAGIRLLAITEEVLAFSEALIDAGAIPQKAIGDSLHVALSAVHGIDYLLTWNYRHIDNAEAKPIIRRVCAEYSYEYPETCRLQELMGGYENG